MAVNDGGRLVFDRPLLAKAKGVLDGAPEQPAVDAVAAIAVDAGAFGLVPGAAAAANRVTEWVTHSRTEMGRVTDDVADLGRRTGMAHQLIDQLDADTKAIAESAAPKP